MFKRICLIKEIKKYKSMKFVIACNAMVLGLGRSCVYLNIV